MKKHNEVMLLLTALIWGTGFVAQSTGGDAVGPWSFNCIRSIVGGLVLILITKIFDKFDPTRAPKTKEEKKTLIIGGIVCGIVLCIASNLQQLGITLGTAAGKAGFLTACYIIIVPILGVFLGKKCGLNVWVAVAIAVVGLYLLCMEGSFYLELKDTLLILCAVAFAFHIIVVDHFSPKVDGIRLSCIQFLTCGIVTVIPMIFTEMRPWAGEMGQWLALLSTKDAWISILYSGVMVCGGAYTLQIIGQKGADPTVCSVIFSLESVFSVIAGWIILKERLGGRALLGCFLIFFAVILAQVADFRKKSVSA